MNSGQCLLYKGRGGENGTEEKKIEKEIMREP